MSNVQLVEGTPNGARAKTFTVDDGGQTAHVQGIAVVDSATGLPAPLASDAKLDDVIAAVNALSAKVVEVDTGNVTISNFPATQPVSGPLTDTQLRANPVPTITPDKVASGTITNLNDALEIDCEGYATGSVVYGGGEVAVGNQYAAQASVDGVSWGNIPLYFPKASLILDYGITDAYYSGDVFQFACAGYKKVRIRKVTSAGANPLLFLVRLNTQASSLVVVSNVLTVKPVDNTAVFTVMNPMLDAMTHYGTENVGAIEEIYSLPMLTIRSSADTPDAIASGQYGPLYADLKGRLKVVPAGYDAGDDMVKVKSVQKKWRDSFVGAALNAAKWDSVVGTGGAITVGSGLLTLGSGTTINSETYVLSKETFTIPFRVNIGLTLSQRIANQTFLVEAISVDPVTGIPDGLHALALLFDGATATQAKYRVQNSGATPLDSAASTFPTTASAGFYELEPFADECWFHGGTLDSNTGRANSYRRHQQIPEPNAVFKIRLRWLNGGSVPASNTNAVVQYISVQDYAELTAEITAGRGQTVAGQAIGVAVTSMPTTAVTLSSTTANIGTSGLTIYTDSSTNLGSAAAFTGTSRDAGSTAAYNLFVANAYADQAGTLEIQKSTDGTTWRRAASVAVGVGEAKELVARVTTRYNRVLFTNGGVAQTACLLTSAYQRI